MVIYLVLNRSNGKVYVGQCVGSIGKRWSGHKTAAINRGSKYYFHAAIRKHGVDSFSVHLLSSHAGSQSDLDAQEQYYIAKYRSAEREFGYNISLGGSVPMQGRKHTKETKERQSAAAKAWRNGKVLKRAPMTDETKQKISRVLTGRVPTFPKGSKMPEATKSKIREAKKNISAETREKLRLAALIREAKRRESR